MTKSFKEVLYLSQYQANNIWSSPHTRATIYWWPELFLLTNRTLVCLLDGSTFITVSWEKNQPLISADIAVPQSHAFVGILQINSNLQKTRFNNGITNPHHCFLSKFCKPTSCQSLVLWITVSILLMFIFPKKWFQSSYQFTQLNVPTKPIKCARWFIPQRPCHTFPDKLHGLFACIDFPASRKISAANRTLQVLRVPPESNARFLHVCCECSTWHACHTRAWHVKATY